MLEEKNKSQAADVRRIDSTRLESVRFASDVLGLWTTNDTRTSNVRMARRSVGGRVAGTSGPERPGGELVAGQLSLNHSVGRTLSLGRYYATAKAIAY